MSNLVDDNRLRSSALAWMYEMELLNNPTVQTNIQENIFLSDFNIQDCELLLITQRREILVFIKISWLANLFKKKKVISNVEERISKLLPSFRYRVVTDYSIFELALEKLKKVYGGVNEKTNDLNNDPNEPTSQNTESGLRDPQDLLSDKKE